MSRPVPFASLPGEAQAMMSRIIDSYFDQHGLPPGLDLARARAAMIQLVEIGGARIYIHGDAADPMCEYSIEVFDPERRTA